MKFNYGALDDQPVKLLDNQYVRVMVGKRMMPSIPQLVNGIINSALNEGKHVVLVSDANIQHSNNIAIKRIDDLNHVLNEQRNEHHFDAVIVVGEIPLDQIDHIEKCYLNHLNEINVFIGTKDRPGPIDEIHNMVQIYMNENGISVHDDNYVCLKRSKDWYVVEHKHLDEIGFDDKFIEPLNKELTMYHINMHKTRFDIPQHAYWNNVCIERLSNDALKIQISVENNGKLNVGAVVPGKKFVLNSDELENMHLYDNVVHEMRIIEKHANMFKVITDTIKGKMFNHND
jgi:hypothetical protein